MMTEQTPEPNKKKRLFLFSWKKINSGSFSSLWVGFFSYFIRKRRSLIYFAGVLIVWPTPGQVEKCEKGVYDVHRENGC